MTVLGMAEIVVHANTAGFRKELESETAPAFAGMRKDAEAAGADAGAGLRTGVSRETGKLAGDMEKDGAKAGEGLHKGMSGGLSKLAGLISATGLPLGALSGGLEKAGSAAEHADSKAGGLGKTLDHVGGVALMGFAGAGAAVAAVGVDMAEKMQSADAAIAAAGGTSIKAATGIGDAFLGTAGKTEFGAQAIATAFAGVAGQLKSTQGHALDSAQALSVMNAAMELATAKGISLGDSTSTVAGVMQAFQIKAAGAGHVSDVLFTASTATGQSIDTLGSALEKVRAKLGPTAGSVGDLAGLLVDMTNQGVTGRAAMTGLNSGLNTLEKTANGVTTATSAQQAAYDQMSPSLKKLADAYKSGSVSSSQFTTATNALPPAQAGLAKSFATATTAVQTAQLKFREMGVTAFDATGKFVGMGSIIEQLHPKFAAMSQAQQLAAASTLFGAGAARQMVAVINAGPAAYDKATSSVNKNGAAHAAAAKQASTLHVEEQTLMAEMGDLATRIGSVLIPIITSMIGWFVKATTFVVDHKAALIALGAVIAGILGPAIAVFTINKMASFGQSFIAAGGHVKDFASGVQSAVRKVIGLFTQQTAASDAATGKLKTNAAAGATAVNTEATGIQGASAKIDAAQAGTATAAEGAAGKIEASSAAAGTSFTAEATKASTAAGIVEGAVATEAGDVTAASSTIKAENVSAGASFTAEGAEALAAGGVLDGAVVADAAAVTTADTAIEAENVAAGASFTAMLGPIAAVGAAAALLQGPLGKLTQAVNVGGNNIPPGSTPSSLYASLLKAHPGQSGNIISTIHQAQGAGLLPQGPITAGGKTISPNLATQGPGFTAGAPVSASALAANTTAVNQHTTATQQLTGVITPLANAVPASGEMAPGAANAAAGFGAGSGNVQANEDSFAPAAVTRWAAIAQAAAAKYGIPASLLLADIDQESTGDPNSVSPTGAFGTTQFEPATAAKYGVKAGSTTADVTSQIMGQAHYLADLGGRTNPTAALEGYLTGTPGSSVGASYAQQVLGGQHLYSQYDKAPAPPSSTTKQKAAATSAIPVGIAAMLSAANALVGTHYSHVGNHEGTGQYDPIATLKKIGVDCSGFVSAVLHAGGVSFPGGPQTTTGIAADLAKGAGPKGGVTVYDRANAGGQSHTIISIAGKYYESGGNSQFNPSGGVSALTAAQAKGELAGGGFVAYHPANIPGGNAVTAGTAPGTTPAAPGPTAAQTAAANAAKALAATIKATEASIATLQTAIKSGTTHSTINPRTGAVHSTHTALTGAAKLAADAELAALKAALTVEMAQQKAALSTQTTDQKTTLAKQGSDVKAGTTVLNTLLTAVHSGSMKSIGAALTAAHSAGLSKIESALDHDHSAAMSALSDKLNQVHKSAMATYVSDEKAATAAKNAKLIAQNAAADQALIAAAQATWDGLVATYFTNLGATITAATSAQATGISDSTKVFLDQQAEVGLTGAALAAAQAQTSLDTVTAQQNALIAAAQAQVSAAAGGSSALQAQAGELLAAAQGNATVVEATAQSVLDKANAAASAASTAASAADTLASTAASAAAAAATQGDTLIADQAKAQADQIADATRVYLDQQAQAGLSGAALTAAQAQTALDQVTATQNQFLDSAQQGVDAASSGDATAQQAAATLLAQAQATATIQEATAQSVLDKANAAASAASATSSTTPTATPTTPTTPANITLNIYGNGAMTASQLLSEVGWAISTGALPVAPPPPVPAVA
jgi:hypothetical protein